MSASSRSRIAVDRLSRTHLQVALGQVGVDDADEPRADAVHRGEHELLRQPDADVHATDARMALDVVVVVHPGKHRLQPRHQGQFQAFDLLLAAGDHLARVGVRLDGRVEVVDDGVEMWRRDRVKRADQIDGVLVEVDVVLKADELWTTQSAWRRACPSHAGPATGLVLQLAFARSRTVRTGREERRTTFSATLPSSRWASPVRPWVPERDQVVALPLRQVHDGLRSITLLHEGRADVDPFTAGRLHELPHAVLRMLSRELRQSLAASRHAHHRFRRHERRSLPDVHESTAAPKLLASSAALPRATREQDEKSMGTRILRS